MPFGNSSKEKSKSLRIPHWPSKPPESISNFIVRVDSREKTPYDFRSVNDHTVLTYRDTLTTGDYAINIEGKTPKWAAVERKSKEDFLKCCGSDRERFFKQIRLLRGTVDRPLLIIEADLTSLEQGDWRGSLSAAVVLSTLSAVMTIGMPVLLARTRREAERACHRHLRLAMQEKYREAREFAKIIHADSSLDSRR